MPRTQRSGPASAEVYQLKVTLRGSRPPIWRRLRVLGSTSLDTLHWILQDAMGWTNAHLHQFTVGRRRIAKRYPDDDLFDPPPEDSRHILLQDLRLGKGARFTYLYDFGDHWEHQILVEDVLSPVAGEAYPSCTAGARACPPEDSGGVHGYVELVAALRDPGHPEHADYLEWAPDGFDPEAFDAAAVSRLLQRFYGPSRRSKGSKPQPEP